MIHSYSWIFSINFSMEISLNPCTALQPKGKKLAIAWLSTFRDSLTLFYHFQCWGLCFLSWIFLQGLWLSQWTKSIFDILLTSFKFECSISNLLTAWSWVLRYKKELWEKLISLKPIGLVTLGYSQNTVGFKFYIPLAATPWQPLRWNISFKTYETGCYPFDE